MREVIALRIEGSCIFRIKAAVLCKGQQVATGCGDRQAFDRMRIGNELREIIGDRNVPEADIRAILYEGRGRKDQVVQALVIVDKGAGLASDSDLFVKIRRAGS